MRSACRPAVYGRQDGEQRSDSRSRRLFRRACMQSVSDVSTVNTCNNWCRSYANAPVSDSRRSSIESPEATRHAICRQRLNDLVSIVSNTSMPARTSSGTTLLIANTLSVTKPSFPLRGCSFAGAPGTTAVVDRLREAMEERSGNG
jgi:hypothetical protein